jgi:hypothetical protein
MSNKYKKILYEWGEIPYMYAALTGISNENLAVLLSIDALSQNGKLLMQQLMLIHGIHILE